jgi:uncharacterized protein YfaS (alpha-2-macroglobulin family)
MSLSGDRLARAEARSQLARARLKSTALQLRARLAPRQLFDDALGELRHAGEAGAERAKQHPFAVASVVALLSTLAMRSRRRKKATETDADSLTSKRDESRRTRRSK